MFNRIVEEVSIFSEALFNQIPHIRRKRELEYETRIKRTVHIGRVTADEPMYPKHEPFSTILFTLSDKEFDAYLDTYFHNKLVKTMQSAVSDFICNRYSYFEE